MIDWIDEDEYSYSSLKPQKTKQVKDVFYLSEEDFYPPEDKRTYGLKGSKSDSIEEFREEYYQYIESNNT